MYFKVIGDIFCKRSYLLIFYKVRLLILMQYINGLYVTLNVLFSYLSMRQGGQIYSRYTILKVFSLSVYFQKAICNVQVQENLEIIFFMIKHLIPHMG